MLDLFITACEYVERIRLEQNGPDVDRICPKSIAGLDEEQRLRALQKTEEVERRRKQFRFQSLERSE